MISFRYHVVSIVSVLLALAVGIVLGGGPLRGRVDDNLVQNVSDSAGGKALEQQDAELRARAAVDDRFAAAVAPGLVRGSLRGHVVTLVVVPTAGNDDVAGLRTMVRVAGASVGGVVRVEEQLVDAGEKQLVEELGAQLQGRARDVRLPADVGSYERIGALLGRAVGVAKRGGEPVDGTATSILAGLETAGLVSVDDSLRRRGDLVLFVTGEAQGSAPARKGAATIVTSLVRSVDGRTGGVVLTGPAPEARSGGLLAAVRDDVPAARAVSTVDSLDSAAGTVATVLALAGQATGRTGHYGGAGADGALPPTASR